MFAVSIRFDTPTDGPNMHRIAGRRSRLGILSLAWFKQIFTWNRINVQGHASGLSCDAPMIRILRVASMCMSAIIGISCYGMNPCEDHGKDQDIVACRGQVADAYFSCLINGPAHLANHVGHRPASTYVILCCVSIAPMPRPRVSHLIPSSADAAVSRHAKSIAVPIGRSRCSSMQSDNACIKLLGKVAALSREWLFRLL